MHNIEQIRNDQLNYLWPQYSLPWNNFFGRIRPNPWYLSNELRNLAIRAEASPLVFDSQTGVNYKSGATLPDWSTFDASASKIINNQSTRSVVATHTDNMGAKAVEYQYDISSSVVFTQSTSIQPTGLLTLSINLAKKDGQATNTVAYTNTSGATPNACQVGTTYFNSLTGSVSVGGKTYSLANALPYDSCQSCPNAPASSVLYSIQGNRLFVSVPVSNSPATSAGVVVVNADLRVIEILDPLISAMNPLA